MSDPQHPDAAGTPGPEQPELDADVAIEEPGAVSPEADAAADAGATRSTARRRRRAAAVALAHHAPPDRHGQRDHLGAGRAARPASSAPS